jgi:hypothetical protein
MLRSVALFALVSTCAAMAQDAPFRVEEPFAGGERWALREELVTRELPVGEAEEEGEVSRVTWTETATVLRRAQGFALRMTLDSFHVDSRAPNVETRVRFDEEDLRDVPRELTFELDSTWSLLDVSGQREVFAGLYDRMMGKKKHADDGGCDAGRWFGKRARPFVVDRWSRGFERWQKMVINERGAPIRLVMARLRDGEVEPGFTARLEAQGHSPAGTVRFAGRDERGARFTVEFDVARDAPAPEYAFWIDDAGRLTRIETTRTKVEGGTRTTTEYVYALERVEQGEEPGPQGVDTGAEQAPGDVEHDPVDDQATPRGRGEPF